MSTRPLYVHIGASKTGTSALQRGLFSSVDELAAQGLGMPLISREDHVTSLLRPLGWVTASGFVGEPDPERLALVAARIRDTPGDRLLLTCEDLCELDPERIDLFVGMLEDAGTEPRVVLSVRALSSVVPSEWQQYLKHRLTLDYPTFLDRVHERRGRWAKHFWQRQDVEAICERWAARVGTDRMDVVVTPHRATDPDGLYRIFGATVGFDPDRLTWPTKDVNASWGYVEAEVYRRLNVELGERLPRYEQQYQPTVRWPFIKGVLPRGRGERITLPPEHLDWVAEVARSHVDYLRRSDIRVHGDLELLVPGPDKAAPLPTLDEAEIASTAIETLANHMVHTRKRHGRVRRAGSPAAPPASLTRRVVGRLRGSR